MLDTIAKQLGPGFVVPAILILVVGWLAKVLMDMHISSRQSRRDFLDLWRTVDRQDDLALETVIRHLWGSYVPAPVIRAALQAPYPSDTLRRLTRVWDHLRFDSDAGQLVIASHALFTVTRRRLAAFGFLLGYVALAAMAMLLLHNIARASPTDLLSWLRVVLAIVSVIGAIGCLGRSDSVSALNRDGVALTASLNAHLVPVPTRLTRPPARAHAHHHAL